MKTLAGVLALTLAACAPIYAADDPGIKHVLTPAERETVINAVMATLKDPDSAKFGEILASDFASKMFPDGLAFADT